MKEPVKYEQFISKNGSKQWRITEEWKLWRKHKLHGPSKPPRKTQNNKKVTQENHVARWKVVAWFAGNDSREILLCACMAHSSEDYRGCGAMARRSSRNAQLEVILEGTWGIPNDSIQ